MKNIILGTMLLSTLSMASENTSIFTNKIGINITNTGKQNWDKNDFDKDIFKNSFGTNYKLFFNTGNRFRLGTELAYDHSSYGGSFQKYKFKSKTKSLFMAGLTGELDLYKNNGFVIYIDGSGGVAYSKATKHKDSIITFILKPTSYVKLGTGTKLANGFGAEVGGRILFYDGTFESKDFGGTQAFYRNQLYMELNYSF